MNCDVKKTTLAMKGQLHEPLEFSFSSGVHLTRHQLKLLVCMCVPD